MEKVYFFQPRLFFLTKRGLFSRLHYCGFLETNSLVKVKKRFNKEYVVI